MQDSSLISSTGLKGRWIVAKGGRQVFTVPVPTGGWANKSGGVTISRHELKATAQAGGRQLAKAMGAEHVILGRDGKIQEKNSYGHDPFPPRG